MSIIRVVKNNRQRFLITDIEIHLRKDISWEARGLHAYLMSKPDHWQIRMAELISAGPAGKDKIRRILEELEKAGYVNRKKVHDQETGKFKSETEFYECVDLNPGRTPTYGGNGKHQGGKPDVDQGGFTRAGKPAHIVKTDLAKRNKDSLKDFETPGPFPKSSSNQQGIHDMTVALVSVCKGFANVLVPDGCPFNAASITLLQSDRTVEQVLSFKDWWEKNRSYSGQPALRSLMDNLDNSISGVTLTKARRPQSIPPDLTQARVELDRWIGREITAKQFSSPHTLPAIKTIGEATVRDINDFNRKTILSKFNQAFLMEKASDQSESRRI